MEETLHRSLAELVFVRDLSEAEIPFISQYWYHSPPEALDAMGADRSKLPPEGEFQKGLQKKCRGSASKLNALVIVYEDRAVGFHTINPLIEGDYGVFHAHIWDAGVRRRGIASISYIKACALFMERFNLKRILFKTPVQNTGAIRVKEKLGIRRVGEEVIGFGIIKDGTLAEVFELTRAELDFQIAQMANPDVDLSQIGRNLSLSLEDRLREHQNSLDLVLDLEAAGQKLREQSK